MKLGTIRIAMETMTATLPGARGAGALINLQTWAVLEMMQELWSFAPHAVLRKLTLCDACVGALIRYCNLRQQNEKTYIKKPARHPT